MSSELSAENYEYFGFVNCTKCGYEFVFDCFITEMMDLLKNELPAEELTEFLKNHYNPNSEIQEFEINGKRLRYVISFENSLSSESMGKEKKGLTDKELIEKYGDVKNPDFNKALKRGLDTRKQNTTPGKFITPPKKES